MAASWPIGLQFRKGSEFLQFILTCYSGVILGTGKLADGTSASKRDLQHLSHDRIIVNTVQFSSKRKTADICFRFAPNYLQKIGHQRIHLTVLLHGFNYPTRGVHLEIDQIESRDLADGDK